MKKSNTYLLSLFYMLMLNSSFFLYFALFQPPLFARLRRLEEASAPSLARADTALGLFLIMMVLVELLGSWLTYPGLLERLRRGMQRTTLGLSVVGTMILAHIGLITFLFTWRVTWVLGVDITGDPPMLHGFLAFAFFMAMIAKEGALLEPLMQILQGSSQVPDAHVPRFSTELFQRTAGWSAVLGDLLLVLFGAVAYTVLWETLSADVPFTATTLSGQGLEYLGAVGLFCLVVPAAQLLPTLESWLTHRPLGLRLLSGASFLLTLIIAILGIRRLY